MNEIAYEKQLKYVKHHVDAMPLSDFKLLNKSLSLLIHRKMP